MRRALPVVPAVALLAGDGEDGRGKAEFPENRKAQRENFLIPVIEGDGRCERRGIAWP